MAILRGSEHVFELANDRYDQLVGHRDILGKPVREALPEIEGQGIFELLDAVYRTGEAFSATDMRVMVQRVAGRPPEERYLEFVYQPLRDADGSVSGILVQGIDSTDRKRAEADVRNRDERLQLFLGNATDYAIIITDARGDVIEWKGGAETITGWREDEVLGTSAEILFTPEDRASGSPAEEMKRAVEFGRAEDKRWHQRKDGSRFFADGVLTSLRGPAGELKGFGKVLRDVTERKRSEEALARDALLLANVRDSVVVTDMEGVVTYWNEGATRLFGWSAEEMLGRPYADRYPEPTRSEIIEEIQTRVGGAEWSGEYLDYRKDGSRVWIDARVSRVSDAAGRPVGILGLAHDITDRKKAEEALKEADRRKDEFLAILAHELRNPLAPLRNGLQVLRLASEDTAVVAQSREMMDRQLTHMVRLIDDLLDISRISRNKIELRRQRVMLSDIVINSIDTARPLIEAAEHKLSVSLPPEPLFLDADLTRLAQVLSNLLTNSAKYTERGGHIWLTAERDESQVVVSLRDTGIGIPPEAVPHLRHVLPGRPQHRAYHRRPRDRTGPRESPCRAAWRDHRGRERGHGQGQYLHAASSARRRRREPRDTPPTAKSERDPESERRILVVDDNEDAARSMARVLKLLGKEVHVAHDGHEALRAAAEFRPEIILMDLGMPGLNGYEATRRIRALPWGESVAIIALTGWGQEADRLLSKQAGCDAHLVKPVNLPDLERILDELAERSVPRPPSV